MVAVRGGMVALKLKLELVLIHCCHRRRQPASWLFPNNPMQVPPLQWPTPSAIAFLPAAVLTVELSRGRLQQRPPTQNQWGFENLHVDRIRKVACRHQRRRSNSRRSSLRKTDFSLSHYIGPLKAPGQHEHSRRLVASWQLTLCHAA